MEYDLQILSCIHQQRIHSASWQYEAHLSLTSHSCPSIVHLTPCLPSSQYCNCNILIHLLVQSSSLLALRTLTSVLSFLFFFRLVSKEFFFQHFENTYLLALFFSYLIKNFMRLLRIAPLFMISASFLLPFLSSSFQFIHFIQDHMDFPNEQNKVSDNILGFILSSRSCLFLYGLIPQRVVLPSRGAWIHWRNGPKRIS